MEKKQRFFIYDRKEVGVLMLLGVMVAVFAFTLGVHLGKRVTGGKAAAPHAAATEGVTPVAEAPTHAETEQAMTQPTAVPPAMSAASEDAVNQATHDEVTRTGIKLEDSKQLELPEKTKTKNAGATSLTAVPTPHETSSEEAAPHHEATPTEAAPAEAEGEVPVTHAKATSKKHAAHKKHVEEQAPEHAAEAETPQEKQQSEALAELHALNEKAKHAAHGKTSGPYTLQIGSYSEMKEAQERVKDLEISGLSPRIHATDIKAKGRWYRIYLGGFATKAAAEKAGGKYRAQGMIDSFIVAKSVE